jgi:hypothetical protein
MKRILGSLLGVAVVVIALVAQTGSASAAWNQNRIIDDNVFNNVASFGPAQIDSFLNTFPNSCLSTHRGFSAPDPIGYSPGGGYTYGGQVSGGTVIAHAAQAYGLNPQVLLVTLQKEQSLVIGDAGCSTLRYAGATGLGCPDGGSTYNYTNVNLYSINGVMTNVVNGTCVNGAAKVGFSQQLIRSAWLLKFSQERSLGHMGWAVIAGSWDNSDDLQTCYSGPMTAGRYQVCPSGSTTLYDGYRTIDGVAVSMGSGATAALYYYTPHFHGNQNFSAIWENWWGATLLGTYNWSTRGYAIMNPAKTVSIDPGHLQPGETYVAILEATNTGGATWMKGGPNPTHLAASNPTSRNSGLCNNTWIACNRPAGLTEDSVAPGETGHFEFTFTAPTTPGLHGESFKPVAEMLSWFNDYSPSDGFGIWVDTPGTYKWSTSGFVVKDKGGVTVDARQLKPGEKYDVSLSANNVGTATWKNNGPIPVTLATSNPNNSALCSSTWLNCQRPVKLQEAAIAPGQTGHFLFEIQAPFGVSTVREWFKPVAEMFTWFNDAPFNELGVSTVAGTYRWSTTGFVVKQSTTVIDPMQLHTGQTYTATVDATNTGTATWTNTGATPIHLATSNPTSRMSSLCSAGWIACNRPALLTEASVAPGQTGHFTFTFQAPAVGTYREWFKPVAENLSWFNDAPFNELGTKVLP